MKITRLETFVIADGANIDPDKGAIEPLAVVCVHTDAGLTGLTEVFRIPPVWLRLRSAIKTRISAACWSARRSRIPNGSGSTCGIL